MVYWWENTEEQFEIAEMFGPNYKPIASGHLFDWRPECKELLAILRREFHVHDPTLFTALEPCDLDPFIYPRGRWHVPEYCNETGREPQLPNPGPDVIEAVRALNKSNGEQYVLREAVPTGLIEPLQICLEEQIVWLKKCKKERLQLGSKMKKEDKDRWEMTLKYVKGKEEDAIIVDIKNFDYTTVEPDITVKGIRSLLAIYLSMFVLVLGKDKAGYSAGLYGPHDYVMDDTDFLHFKELIEGIEIDIIKFLYAVITVDHMDKYECTNDLFRELLRDHTCHKKDHADRLKTYQTDIERILNKMHDFTQETDTPLKERPRLTGSARENLKVFTPDEFDYMIDIDVGREIKDVHAKREDLKNFREKCLKSINDSFNKISLKELNIPNLKEMRHNACTKFPQILLHYCYDPPEAGYKDLIVKVDMVLCYSGPCEDKDKNCKHQEIRTFDPDGGTIPKDHLTHESILPNTNDVQTTLWRFEHVIMEAFPELATDAVRALKVVSSLLLFPTRVDDNCYLPTSYDIKNALVYASDRKPQHVEPDKGQLLSKFRKKWDKLPGVLPDVVAETVTMRDNIPDCDECRLIETMRIAKGIMSTMQYLTAVRITRPFFQTEGRIYSRLCSWHHIYYKNMKIMLDRIAPCKVHGTDGY